MAGTQIEVLQKAAAGFCDGHSPCIPTDDPSKPHVTVFYEEETHTVCCVVRDPSSNKVAVVDSVMRFDFSSGNTNTEHADQVIRFIERSGFELEWILETHAHADHLSAAPYIQSKLGGKIAIGENIKLVQEVFSGVFNLGPNFRKDGSQFDHLFADGETFKLGELPASVMYTPGHTPACVCYLIGDALFTGDTLFMPDYGTARCDFPGGSSKTLYASIQRILQLPDATRVFVGHDYLPKGGRSHFAWETTIGDEKNSNIHIGGGMSEEDFVNMRNSRDAQLAVPKLIVPSVQCNIRAGRFPEPDENGKVYLSVPVNVLSNRGTLNP